mmetsp:Transcript_19672/g.35123  ORF Transcript_19672/g.35123 Transcript_19672/m.35123 type:complete len:203 (+) Transcript_19672:113-721(+)
MGRSGKTQQSVIATAGRNGAAPATSKASNRRAIRHGRTCDAAATTTYTAASVSSFTTPSVEAVCRVQSQHGETAHSPVSAGYVKATFGYILLCISPYSHSYEGQKSITRHQKLHLFTFSIKYYFGCITYGASRTNQFTRLIPGCVGAALNYPRKKQKDLLYRQTTGRGGPQSVQGTAMHGPSHSLQSSHLLYGPRYLFLSST